MEVAMLSRTILSVLAFSSVLAVAPRAGAAAGYTPDGSTCGAPFDAKHITSVAPYKVVRTNLRQSSTRVEGAIVNVPAQPGMTREWLQRLVDDPAAAQSGCPMGVDGASGRVTSTGQGFAITVSSQNRDGAREILRRAEALTSQ
jgi:hypothetical protein